MDYEKFLDVLDILDQIGVDGFVVTGGEPFSHPQWIQFVSKAMNKFPKVTITSNGSFSKSVAEELLPFLEKNLYLQISVDGTKKIHDKLRGKGAYDKVIDNLINLKKVANHVALSTTVNSINCHDIKNLASILSNYSFSHWKVALEQAANPKLSLSINDWNKLIDDFLPVCQFRVSTQKLFDFDLLEKSLQRGISIDSIVFNCGMGRTKFYISPSFDVLLCSCINDRIGNLLVDGAHRILDNLKKYSKITISEESVCFKCKYKLVCNGGCPGYSKKVFGAYNMGDIRCPIVYDKYEKC